MNSSLYTTVFITGAALLAVWVEARFPALRPEEMRDALIRVGAALLLNGLFAPAFGTWLASRGLFLFSLFTVTLTSLVALFVAAIWAMRRLQAALAGRFF